MDPIILEIIQWAIPLIGGGIIGYLAERLKKVKSENKAIADGVQVLLLSQIHSDYEHYVVLHEHMTVSDKEVHERTFAAYEALGGNGVAKSMHEEIMARRPWIVVD